MPAMIAACTRRFACSTSIPDLYSASKTAIAASEPEPIVTYGSESVEPCG